jgi:hypothetical protein
MKAKPKNDPAEVLSLMFSALASAVPQPAPKLAIAPAEVRKPKTSRPLRHIRSEDLQQSGPKQIFQHTILNALKAAGYEPFTQTIEVRPFGGHRTNSYEVFERGGRTFAVTLKWQAIRGTADRKIPYEVIVLSEMIANGEIDGAYLLIGGKGWAPQLRDAYTAGVLKKWIKYPANLVIMEVGDFLKKLEEERI